MIIPRLTYSPAICKIAGLFCFCLGSFNIHGANLDEAASSFTWLKLSHYEPAARQTSYQSKIISTRFFLAPNGSSNPLRELEATIDAFSLPFSDDKPDDHAICRYPARYFWLKKQSLIDLIIDPFAACKKFNRWAKPEGLESISLILVSEYLGNPASSFGHVLLKINNAREISESDLLNQAVNYGAIVPENENGILYALFGLFGGYEASFTAKDVFEETHIYLDKELRDIWEYRLNLNDSQVKFLVSHLWEMIGQKFRYYFVGDNCAYRMGQLLELVHGSPLIPDNNLWNIPASIFFSIKENSDLFASTKFIPSSQRVVIDSYENLDSEEKSIFYRLIHEDLLTTPEKLDENSKIRLTDALIRYYQYKIYDDEDNIETYKGRKNHWLLQRIQYPVQESFSKSYTGLTPPTSGHKPSLFNVTAHNFFNDELALELGIAVSYHDLTSFPTAKSRDSEFVAIDSRITITEDEVLFSKFIFVKLARYITKKTVLFGDRKLSWRLELGYESEEARTDRHGFFAKAGIGKSKYFGDVLAYTFVDANYYEYEIYKEEIGVDLVLGTVIRPSSKYSGLIEILEPLNSRDTSKTRLNITARYSFDRNSATRINIALRENSDTSLGISYHYYW